MVVAENKKLKFAMQDTYDSANDTCGELQQRIDKAIEYIEKYTEYLDIEKGEVFECMGARDKRIPIISTKEVLKILKGEINEKDNDTNNL